MEAMVEREVSKFGDVVERELTPDQRRLFLRALSSEAARDMAENGTSAISDATLSWLVEVALPKEVSEPVLRILKGRAQVIAFLTNDDRNGYKRFFHDKFYEYFLSLSLVDLIVSGASGKVLSRSLFGSSILETFSEVISSGIPTSRAQTFLTKSVAIVRDHPPIDSTRKNVASLVIASLAVADLINAVEINSVELDECRFSSTAASAKLVNVIISQLDCRGADLSAVIFENSLAVTLIADQDTIVPYNFPIPNKIHDISLGGKTLTKPEEKSSWLARHFSEPIEKDKSLVPADMREHKAFKLLFKACRLRQYWLRRGDDVYATKILDDYYWPLIEKALDENSLLKVEMRPASGTDPRFIHVRQPEDILSENENDLNVVNMFKSLGQRFKAQHASLRLPLVAAGSQSRTSNLLGRTGAAGTGGPVGTIEVRFRAMSVGP